MTLDLWEEEMALHAARMRTMLRVPENAPINIEVPRTIWMQFSIQRLVDLAHKHNVYVLDSGNLSEDL